MRYKYTVVRGMSQEEDKREKGIKEGPNRNSLSIIQATVSNVIWQKHQSLPTSKEVLDALEAEFRKAGGAQTYLQLANMVKIQITDSTDLLPQIQNFRIITT